MVKIKTGVSFFGQGQIVRIWIVKSGQIWILLIRSSTSCTPNCMPDIIPAQAFLQLFCSQDFLLYKSRKRDITHSNNYRILPKVNQVIYTLDASCLPNIMILAVLLCSQCPLSECLSLKRSIIRSNFNRILHVPKQKLHARCYGPRSSGSPDILFTRFH